MKSVKLYFACLAIACRMFTEIVNAQDIHFSQFTQSPLTLNPALAGSSVWIRAGLIYRDQWRAVHSVNSNSSYTTLGASFDIKTKKRRPELSKKARRYRQAADNGFGWGVNIYNDKAGDGHIGTLSANATLAYQIMFNEKSMFALGFQGGMMQRSIQMDKLYWGTQYDPNSSTGYNTALPADHAATTGDDNFFLPDLSAGITYAFKKNTPSMRGNTSMDFTLGAAIFHAAPFHYSFLSSTETIYPRMVFHGTSTIGIKNTNMAIEPAALFQTRGPNHEVYLGGMIRYILREDSKYTGYIKGASISAGAYYRNKDAFVAAALFEFSSYGVGVSYDFNLSGLKTVSSGRGGIEITLRFLNPSPFFFSKASFAN